MVDNKSIDLKTFFTTVSELSSLREDMTLSVTKQAEPDENGLATYVIKQGNLQVGPKINIPKDFLLKSVTINTALGPISGTDIGAGDKYFDFVFNTKDNNTSTGNIHSYLNAQDLIDTYTADETTIELNGNEFSLKQVPVSYISGVLPANQVTHQDISGKSDVGHTHDYDNLNNKPNIPSDVSDLTDTNNLLASSADSELNDSSTNAIQNKVVYESLNNILDELTTTSIHLHTDNSIVEAGETSRIYATILSKDDVANKSITFKDGDLVLATKTTDATGKTYYDYVGGNTGAGHISAFYNDIQSEPCIISNILFYESGTDSTVNSNLFELNNKGQKIIASDGTKFTNSNRTPYIIVANIGDTSDSYDFQPPFCVEVDIVEVQGSSSNAESQARFAIVSKSNGMICSATTTGHWKIICNETKTTMQKDNEPETTYNVQCTSTQIRFHIPYLSSMTFKNLKIYGI